VCCNVETCEGSVTRSEESSECGVSECDLEISMRGPRPIWAVKSRGKNIDIMHLEDAVILCSQC
jgi:hypothetical protein